jgi:hypothetical protein
MADNISSRVNQKRFNGTKPLFFASHSVSWEEGPAEMLLLEKELKTRHGEENVVFTRLDHMAMMINEYENRPYNLCLRSETKVTASDETVKPKQAADGTFNTAWTSSKEGDKWISFDLGTEYIVNRYILKNAGMDLADRSLNTTDYEVMVSTDGKTWTSADKVIGNTDDARDIDIDAVKARYVKFVITNPGKDGTARVADVEIYGTQDAPPAGK